MLVKQGEMLEAKTRSAASQSADAAREAAMAKAKEVQAAAGGTWDKLEQVFEDRVSRALARLGVYTSSDIAKLSERVNELSEAVNALLKAPGAGHQAPVAPARTRAKSAPRSATKNVSQARSGTAADATSAATSRKKAKKSTKPS